MRAKVLNFDQKREKVVVRNYQISAREKSFSLFALFILLFLEIYLIMVVLVRANSLTETKKASQNSAMPLVARGGHDPPTFGL